MPNSPKCIVKRLYHNGSISEHERDKLLKALEQEPILDKIRAEIEQYLFENEFGSEYRKEITQIIDKYRAESENK